MRRNRLEISGFKFGKKEAESEAEKIISERKSKIAEAKKEWLEAVKPLREAEEKLAKTESEYNKLKDDTSGEADVANAISDLETEIGELISEIAKIREYTESKRLIKVNRIKKLNIKAYQILPVKCVGKHGGNWVFESEKQ